MRSWIFFSLSTFLFGCSFSQESPEQRETVPLPAERSDSGKLEVFINAPDTLPADSILFIEVRLLNNTVTEQRLLFDKPEPWDIIIKLRDKSTNESALEVESRRLLSSQIYPEDSLTKHYYRLAAGDSIVRIFSILDIAALKHYDPLLPPGQYELELVCNGILSNKLLIIVTE